MSEEYVTLPAEQPAQGGTPSADESAAIMTDKIRKMERFSYFRFGDGYLECVGGKMGQTCDHEVYTGALATNLQEAWLSINRQPEDLFLGDWMSASFDSQSEKNRYADQWEALKRTASPARWLHFEALLFMRESAELAKFYEAVRADKRRKLFMGPIGNRPAAAWLGAEFLNVPMVNLHDHIFQIAHLLANELSYDVLLFGAGMAGNIAVAIAREKHPQRTYINLGSALDPLFRGRSRQQQLSRDRAWQLVGGRWR